MLRRPICSALFVLLLLAGLDSSSSLAADAASTRDETNGSQAEGAADATDSASTGTWGWLLPLPIFVTDWTKD